MLGKLIWFEMKKSLGGKFFPIAVCLLVIVNMVLMCGYVEYQETLKMIERWGGEKISYWEYARQNRQSTVSRARTYAAIADLTPEDIAGFKTYITAKYGEEIFDPFAGVFVTDVYNNYFGHISDNDMVFYLMDLEKRNAQSQESLETIVDAANYYVQKAERELDSYGVRRNQDIIRLYSLPRREITGRVVNWDDVLFDTPTMLLVFLLTLLACADSFTGERDRQTLLLLHTSKNGKGKTLAAKYLAGILTAAGLTVLFQLSSVFATWFKGGLAGLGEPVTALEALRAFPLPAAMWQYVLLELGCQIFAAAVLAVLLTTVSTLSKSGVVSYAAGAILLGGCLLLYYYPPRSEWLAGPLSLANPLKYFSSYYTANIFGLPVLWAVVQAMLWSVIGAGCVILAQKVYHRIRGAV